MLEIMEMARHAIVNFSDLICGYPLFLLLIGGGLCLFIYSKATPLRHMPAAIKALRSKGVGGEGQISSFQALMSTISSTVGMGNIAGVAIALAMGGAGAIFWMWVSALLGMNTKFFEGTLAIMYKGRDAKGEAQGGPMYMMTEGLGEKYRPMAKFFCVFAMIATFCVMQANQLAESFITVVSSPLGWADCFTQRLIIGLFIAALVSLVMIGGIKRISSIATKIVPTMVGIYFILVFAIIVLNFDKLPGVFVDIFEGAFNLKAGIGGMAGVALIGARRAMYVNEAGVGTAGLMHGASRNNEPVREGLIAMIGPAVDSGLVCTLSAIPILMAGNYHVGEVKGLTIALGAFSQMLPGIGQYLLMVVVTIFAFSTMFSYSYYGTKCTEYMFGKKNAKYYDYVYVGVLVISCIISLDTAVSIMDMAFAFMAFPNMYTLMRLAPKVKAETARYFAKNKDE